MLLSQKKNRYNAYMKKTGSGIIVKTVDSVTGFVSLIKFSTDSAADEKSEGDSSKENVGTDLKKCNVDIQCANKSNKNLQVDRISSLCTKLNTSGLNLKEIHQYDPSFHVYEDRNCSSQNFPNPKIIFVANSNLAKDNSVNLTIPAKLGNVYYHGVLGRNGVVKFKADTVVKPFTIIIGDYRINIRICHSLKCDKPSKVKAHVNTSDSGYSSNVCNNEMLKFDKCMKTKETNTESKANLIQSKVLIDCGTQTDTYSDSNHILLGRLEKEDQVDAEKPSPIDCTNDSVVEKDSEISFKNSKSTIKSFGCLRTLRDYMDGSLENCFSKDRDETKMELPSSDCYAISSGNLSFNLESSTSENHSFKSDSSNVVNNHIPKYMETSESLGIDTNIFHVYCNRHLLNIGPVSSGLSNQSDFETQLPKKEGSERSKEATEESEHEPVRPTQTHSSSSLVRIRKKLSEITRSLQTVTSYIESIEKNPGSVNLGGAEENKSEGIILSENVNNFLGVVNMIHLNKSDSTEANSEKASIKSIGQKITTDKDENYFVQSSERNVKSLPALLESKVICDVNNGRPIEMISSKDEKYKPLQAQVCNCYKTKFQQNSSLDTLSSNNLHTYCSRISNNSNSKESETSNKNVMMSSSKKFQCSNITVNVEGINSIKHVDQIHNDVSSTQLFKITNKTVKKSASSIETIYIKSDFGLSNNMKTPSNETINHHNVEKGKGESVAICCKTSQEEKICETSSKRFKKTITRNISKLKSQLKRFGKTYGRKETYPSELPVNSELNAGNCSRGMKTVSLTLVSKEKLTSISTKTCCTRNFSFADKIRNDLKHVGFKKFLSRQTALRDSLRQREKIEK